MRILWCITGAGQFLKESFDFMKKFSENGKVTIVFSNAGYEVAQIYGLLEEIERNFSEIILEKEQGASSPVVGRLPKKEYSLVIVAPCTANTVAKIVYGIADSLVSNIVAQAGKSKVPVYVLPTDAKKIQKTRLPININLEKCINCRPCIAMKNCSQEAFFISDRVRINLLKCNACRKCIELCRYNAIEFGKEVTIECRDIDIENVKKLKKMVGIKVIKNLKEIKKEMK